MKYKKKKEKKTRTDRDCKHDARDLRRDNQRNERGNDAYQKRGWRTPYWPPVSQSINQSELKKTRTFSRNKTGDASVLFTRIRNCRASVPKEMYHRFKTVPPSVAIVELRACVPSTRSSSSFEIVRNEYRN